MSRIRAGGAARSALRQIAVWAGHLDRACAGGLLLLLATGLHLQAADPLGSPEAYRDYALQHTGDAQAGRRLFERDKRLACTACHRITGAEKSGPNLDGIADKYSRSELIHHILRPSASIKPGYEHVTLVTRDGRVIHGRINRANKTMYRVLDGEGKTIDVQRDEVEQIEASQQSMMPDNVASTLSRDEFADLIAYLETLHHAGITGLRGPDDPVRVSRLAEPARLVAIHPPELDFANPVWCGAIPGLAGQLAVVEHQEAKIWRLQPTSGGWQKQLFLDLSGQVKYGQNWGLMCLAFHPRFPENRRYFLKHEVEEQGGVKTTVVERRAAVDLARDAGTPSRRLLEVEQPAFNHNGGCIAFGPDRMLYAAFGDGGPQRDPEGLSQNPCVFHGSMLRIDVDQQPDARPYAIPSDNPRFDGHHRCAQPETWAIGFREPWRFSFDRLTGELWLGDVGQDSFEEICLVRRGQNHGWNVFEAYEPFSAEYRRAGQAYTPPLFAYPHSFGVSVTGGYVYRGCKAESFQGVYIFGDYDTRRIWGIKQQTGRVVAVRELGESPQHITSFGLDDQGEIYVVGYEGTIFHLDLSATRFE